jgi:hypothetical protein
MAELRELSDRETRCGQAAGDIDHLDGDAGHGERGLRTGGDPRMPPPHHARALQHPYRVWSSRYISWQATQYPLIAASRVTTLSCAAPPFRESAS